MQTFIYNKRIFKEYSIIIIASLLYAISTNLFIFPSKVLLGGTSGIAVILASLFPFTPGTFSVIMNYSGAFGDGEIRSALLLRARLKRCLLGIALKRC